MSIYGGLVPLGSDPTTKNPAVVLPIPNSTLNIVYIFLLIIAYLCQKRNLYNKILQLFYSRAIICSVMNTAAQLAAATMIRLCFLNASKTPTASPAAPLTR